MRVFLSWSGRSSKLVAEALRDWLPNVIQSVEPWLSSEDIPLGARWHDEISKRLQGSSVGIVCLTRENLNAAWLQFEAGALSRLETLVCPYLLDVSPSEITGPLAHFQCAQANRDGTFRLLQTLNSHSGKEALSERVLCRAFDLHWPTLQSKLDDIRRFSPPPLTKRSPDEMLEEILALLRQVLAERAASPVKPSSTPVTEPPAKPRVFIGSSSEGLEVAEVIQLGLDSVAECTVWTQSTFAPGQTIIESLVDVAVRCDFAVLVLTPDDVLVKRGEEAFTPRDNIVFEVGLFTGALGRARTFMVYCRNSKLHLPTDLLGVTAVAYSHRSDGNLEAALGPVCTRIKRAMGVKITNEGA